MSLNRVLMRLGKRLAIAVCCLALPFGVAAQCTELFISEYVEGWSNNKALEIYNPTDAPIDLSDYQLERYSNGATAAGDDQKITLMGTVMPGDVLVYVLDKQDPDGVDFETPVWDDLAAAADHWLCPVYEVNNTMYFNGNDALVLRKISTNTPIDIFGVIGEDPGQAGWDEVTQNQTLVRHPEVTGGDTQALDAFDVLAVWDSLGANVFDHLGYHICDCTDLPTAIYGCTDPAATNYNPLATVDDGTCGGLAACDPFPDFGDASFGYEPDGVTTQLESAQVGTAYADAIHIRWPSSVTDVVPDIGFPSLIDSTLISAVYFVEVAMGDTVSLETVGLFLDCSQMEMEPVPDCAFLGGEESCLSLSGTPLLLGEFLLLIEVNVWTTLFGMPVAFPWTFPGWPLTISSVATPVTFRVDMSTQAEVSVNGVCIAGNFQGWNVGVDFLSDDDGDLIYEITRNIAPGDYEFKFINGNNWIGDGDGNIDNENPPGDCTVNGNRFFSVGTEPMTVEYCYNQCSATCAVDPDPSLGCEAIGAEEWADLDLSAYPQAVALMFGVAASEEWVLNVPPTLVEPGSGSTFAVLEVTPEGIAGLPEGLEVPLPTGPLSGGSQACLTATGVPLETGVFEVEYTCDVVLSLFGQPFPVGDVLFTQFVTVAPNPDPIAGCTYPGAANYLAFATIDDGGCIIPGCMDEQALNYHPVVNEEDGSCLYSGDVELGECPSDLSGDDLIGVADLLILLGEFGTLCTP